VDKHSAASMLLHPRRARKPKKSPETGDQGSKKIEIRSLSASAPPYQLVVALEAPEACGELACQQVEQSSAGFHFRGWSSATPALDFDESG